MLLENPSLGRVGVGYVSMSFLPSQSSSTPPHHQPFILGGFLSKAFTVSLLPLLLAEDRETQFPCDMSCFSIKIINMRLFMESLLIQRPQLPHSNLYWGWQWMD